MKKMLFYLIMTCFIIKLHSNTHQIPSEQPRMTIDQQIGFINKQLKNINAQYQHTLSYQAWLQQPLIMLPFEEKNAYLQYIQPDLDNTIHNLDDLKRKRDFFVRKIKDLHRFKRTGTIFKQKQLQGEIK